MKYGFYSTIGEIAATKKGRRVLQKHIRYDEMMQNAAMNFLSTLRETLKTRFSA